MVLEFLKFCRELRVLDTKALSLVVAFLAVIYYLTKRKSEDKFHLFYNKESKINNHIFSVTQLKNMVPSHLNSNLCE